MAGTTMSECLIDGSCPNNITSSTLMANTTAATIFNSIILAAFPPLSTHRTLNYDDNAMFNDYTTAGFGSRKAAYRVQFFPMEGLIAALAVSYCRYTVKISKVSFSSTTSLFVEPRWFRFAAAALLASMAYTRQYEYWVLSAVHVVTYALLPLWRQFQMAHIFKIGDNFGKRDWINQGKKIGHSLAMVLLTILSITCITYILFHPRPTLTTLYKLLLPHPFLRVKLYSVLCYLIPITNIQDAYSILTDFVDEEVLRMQVSHLMFVTFHAQVGMGYLGIEFLTKEQERKNTLVRMEGDYLKQKELQEDQTNASVGSNADELYKNGTNPVESDGKDPVQVMDGASAAAATTTKDNKLKVDVSKTFCKGAVPFILFTAIPYMIQIIFYGCVNMYSFHCFKDDVHRTVRLTGLFSHDGSRFVVTASSSITSSATNVKMPNRSPGAYAASIETVVTTTYDMFNRKMFSLPKLMLLPKVMARQPLLLLSIFPFILLSDFVKGRVVSTLTSEIESLQQQRKDVETQRVRVEQYDLKHSDLIQRSGYKSIPFTQQQWVRLTEQVQDLTIRAQLMQRSRTYFAWLQRNFVMMALVDCALARLIALGKIVAADIFVFGRAMEDTIDLILMKSRAESELASMDSEILKLKELSELWQGVSGERRNLLRCSIDDNIQMNAGLDEAGLLSIKGLKYSRGSAKVRIDDILLKPGVYAVTGANGSGKSTLFRLLMGCDSNKKSIDLSKSIVVESPGTIIMPSDDVVEISQNFYWPLFAKPVDWMYQRHLDNYDNASSFKAVDALTKRHMVKKVEHELRQLHFHREIVHGDNPLDDGGLLRADLTEVKEDWFGDLSGGQKSKVELVRKVFLTERCPKVLLIDETFAPLDPDSKVLVMNKLKDFCSDSIVLVIYHADVKVDSFGETVEETCVQSSNFFDDDLHFENDGRVVLRSVCMDNSAPF